ncbi:MAG: amidohydrolase family protein [Acidobacteria bacterium]|nr:amidohydrolase family protein [Acidobacteriota bacterium]
MANGSKWLAAVLGVLLATPSIRAQNSLPPEVARNGFADIIVVNSKIVSMDDAGVNTNPGSIYQAMAVKGSRIMALGTSDRIRAMADSNTRVIDAKGQLMLPGIIETHAHIFGSQAIGQQLGRRSPDRGKNVTVQAGKDFETTRLRIENRIQEEIKEMPPGDWLVVGVAANRVEGVSDKRIRAWITAELLETKDRLDRLAPENPVIVQNGPRGNINSKVYEVGDQFIPHYTEFVKQTVGTTYADEIEKGFVITPPAILPIQWDVWFRNIPTSLNAEVLRRDLEQAAAHGVTTFSSRVPHPRIMDAFTWLEREKQLPVRFAALYEVHRRPADPQVTRQFYRMTGNLTGLGSDYLWIHGVASEFWDGPYPFACLGPDYQAPPNIKDREQCPKAGEMWYDTLQNGLEAGWRLAGVHGVGSDAVRRFIQMVEQVMKNTGMTVEDIRKMRLTVEHAEALGKIPDVVQGLAKYGIIVSAGPGFIEAQPDYVTDYGSEIDTFIVPVKSLLDQGVKVVGQMEGYRGIGYLWKLFITRQLRDGTKVAPEEAVDRMTVLKMWTTWASQYVMRENELGSLQAGKLADFLILDKDYLTIPVEQIPQIQPQMTVIGGKIQYLDSGFARQLGMEPVGYQFPAGYQPWDRSADMGQP